MYKYQKGSEILICFLCIIISSVPAPGVQGIVALNRILHFGLRRVEFFANLASSLGQIHIPGFVFSQC